MIFYILIFIVNFECDFSLKQYQFLYIMDKFIESELDGFCERSPVLSNMLNMPENLNKDFELKESIADTIIASIKKIENILLLVVEPEIYETLSQDEHMLNSYVSQQLAPWHEDTLVCPYVVLDKDTAKLEYEENSSDYPDKKEYYMKYHGGELNENGEVVSQINPNGEYSSYHVKQIGLGVGDIMNMILSEEIVFKYIVHNGHLCNKNNTESINALNECDKNSYFIIVSTTN